jgi:hypothetical protein
MQQIKVMAMAFMGAAYPLIRAATITELTGQHRRWPRAALRLKKARRNRHGGWPRAWGMGIMAGAPSPAQGP